MWHTSYGNATPAFHKFVEMVICCLVRQQRSSQYHCCFTIAIVRLLNMTSKSSVCNLRKLKAQCLKLDQNYRSIIAQSSDA